MSEKVYQVPENVLAKIINLINALPYGQVAEVAGDVARIMAETERLVVEKQSKGK